MMPQRSPGGFSCTAVRMPSAKVTSGSRNYDRDGALDMPRTTEHPDHNSSYRASGQARAITKCAPLG
jgi:hypothetical protein